MEKGVFIIGGGELDEFSLVKCTGVNLCVTRTVLCMSCKYIYINHTCSCKKDDKRQSSHCSHAEKNYTKTTLGIEEHCVMDQDWTLCYPTEVRC